MTQEPDIKRALHAALDPIKGPTSMPQSLLKKATRRRWMTSAGAVLSVLIIVVGITTGVASLQPPTKTTLPSQQQLRDGGFAVWPEDTVQEGLEACAEAEEWRFDADGTAERYALDVLEYPQPRLNPVGQDEVARYAITSEADELGSVIDLKKYDRCWFVVNVTPREGGFLPSLLFAHAEDGQPLFIIGGGSETEIGYGTWETVVENTEGQTVVDPPDLPPDATGHFAAISSYTGVNSISAFPLGFIPEPATTNVRPLTRAELRETAGVCPGSEGFGSPQLALADLYESKFDQTVDQRGRRPLFRGGNEIERITNDEWILRVDGAELRATVPELKQGCWAVFALNSGNLLDDLKVAEDAFTFDIDWGDATAADVLLGNGRGGDYWTVERLDHPVTVSGLDTRNPLKEPFRATVVLRKEGRIIAAQHRWYQVP